MNFENPAYEWTVAWEKKFSIQVRAWFHPGIDGLADEKWSWNVYAFIFDEHPFFDRPGACVGLPFHGGCTLDHSIVTSPLLGIQYKWQRHAKSIKVGSDYAHYGDERFEHYSPLDGIPSEIKNDVEELYEALINARNVETVEYSENNQ